MSKAVGIRELKTHLSRYVQDVKNGDEILVSERGRVIAKLVSIEPHTEAARFQNLLLKLSAEGQISLPKIQARAALPVRRKKVKGAPLADAVIEDRR